MSEPRGEWVVIREHAFEVVEFEVHSVERDEVVTPEQPEPEVDPNPPERPD